MTDEVPVAGLQAALADLERAAPMPDDLIARAIESAQLNPPHPDGTGRARGWIAPLTAAVVVAAVVALVVVLTSATRRQAPPRPADSPATRASVTGWQRYNAPGFSVEYPPAWAPYPTERGDLRGFTEGIVYLSSVHVPGDCHTATNAKGSSIACTTPSVPLQHGDVLIWWSQTSGLSDGSPALANKSGRSTSIDGHQAKITISTPGSTSSCARSHGIRQIDILIAQSRSSWFEMDACLSDTASHIQRLTHTVLTSAHSARLRR